MESLQKERNYGIELLRILSILFVIMLHILGRGGIYPYAGTEANLAEHPWNYTVAWTLESAVYGAVDLFALISGFVGIRSKFHVKKWMRLWVLVVFWGIGVYFIFYKCTFLFEGFNDLLCKIIPTVKPAVESYKPSWEEIKNIVLTIGTKQYWYFNMYTLLFILMPILNAGVMKLGKKKMRVMVFVIFILASVYKTLMDKDLFVLSGGYSAIWLIIMYLIGATARLYHDDGFKPNIPLCAVGYVLCTGITAGFRFLFDHLYELHPENELFKEGNDILISYTGPFVVIGCVCLLFIFMQIKLKTKVGKKITLIFSSATFGIYIFHVHNGVWDQYLKNRFYKFAYEPTGKMVLHIFITLIALYLFFAAFELARIYLFKLTRIDKLIDMAGEGVTKLVNKIFIERTPKKAVADGEAAIADTTPPETPTDVPEKAVPPEAEAPTEEPPPNETK